MAVLARDYNVHESTIAAAVYGRTWRWVTDPAPLPRPEPTGRRPANIRLTAVKVRHARVRYQNGEPISSLAVRYNVTDDAIFAALHGYSWAGVENPGPIPVRRVGGRKPALDDSDLRRARELRARGLSFRAVADQLGRHHSIVYRALQRDSPVAH